MIKTIKALAADIDMTLSAKGSALPEITVENADGSIRKTKTWGFIYDGPFMINDMHGG